MKNFDCFFAFYILESAIFIYQVAALFYLMNCGLIYSTEQVRKSKSMPYYGLGLIIWSGAMSHWESQYGDGPSELLGENYWGIVLAAVLIFCILAIKTMLTAKYAKRGGPFIAESQYILTVSNVNRDYIYGEVLIGTTKIGVYVVNNDDLGSEIKGERYSVMFLRNYVNPTTFNEARFV